MAMLEDTEYVKLDVKKSEELKNVEIWYRKEPLIPKTFLESVVADTINWIIIHNEKRL